MIFYTGKEKLKTPNLDVVANTNICIIHGRPKLDEVIPNIIYGVESGMGLPENYTPNTRVVACEMLADRLMESNHQKKLRGARAVEDIACFASELGFYLPTEEVSRETRLFTKDRKKVGRKLASETLMNHLTIGFCPWDTHNGAKAYVKNLDRKLILPTWGMLYCGGAKVVQGELEKLSDEYGIGLHVESFAW